MMANFHIPFSFKHWFIISLAFTATLLIKLCIHDAARTPSSDHINNKLASLSTTISPDKVIRLDIGDPTMYEKYWRQMGDKLTIVTPIWQFTSYVSDQTRICWFMEPELADEVLRLHQVVGNAVTEGRHLVVGTGSTQLLQAAFYALSQEDALEPTSVVTAAPFYNSYRSATDCVRSSIYRWGGDAASFSKEGPYIEIVTSPNNPDGYSREPVVKRSGGLLVHDLAYYWPQYTPISSSADHDLMLFTVSKCTGHAGMRLGWALVKDEEVARKMTKYIDLNTIGVSRDSQHRAAKLLKAISDSSEEAGQARETESFFGYGHQELAARWRLLREAVHQSRGQFTLSEFSPRSCNFFGKVFSTQPAFAWLRCEGVDDCEEFLRSNNLMTRGGANFGFSPNYVRISLLDRDENFYPFLQRLSTLKAPQ